MALLCGDERYAERLMDYFNSSKKCMFNVAAFTSMEMYEEYCAHNEVEILLCEEGMYDYPVEATASAVMLLTENMVVCEEHETVRIYKYQSAEDILQDIVKMYTQKIPEYTRTSDGETVIYTVISPSGGSRCSVTAAVMAGVLSEKGRTVFLGLDPFFADERLGIYVDSYGVSEAVCCCRAKDGEERKLCVASNDIFSYVAGCMHWADFTEILPQEADIILKMLGEMGFKYIVIDAGGFYRCTGALLSWSRRVFVPFYDEPEEAEREREWLRQYTLNDENAEKRIVHIRPPYDSAIAERKYNMKSLCEGTLGSWLKEILDV